MPVEDAQWRALKRDRNLSELLREALSGSKIERHATPPPRIDLEFEADERRCSRIGSNVILIAIAGNGYSANRPSVVLAENDVLPSDRRNGFDHLDLLGPDLIGAPPKAITRYAEFT
jgi:hypothetical protein